jgi:hypothetical protein
MQDRDQTGLTERARLLARSAFLCNAERSERISTYSAADLGFRG